MARLFRDAGADYLWADDPSAGSIPLSFEEVFEKGGAADYLGQSSYFEETPIHPDRLLRDLIGVFHPELLPGYELRDFKPLEP